MHINPYLFFDGNCRQAFEFYAKCLGVDIKAMLSTADTPVGKDMPAHAQDKIMHACIAIGDDLLMGSDRNCDGSTDPAPQPPHGFRVSANVDSAAEAERLFNALAEGGSQDMPLEKNFFAERFGMLTDRFGTPWMINCEGGS